mgnify:CR=1 FL=1
MSQVILAQIVSSIADGVNTVLEACVVMAIVVFFWAVIHVVHQERAYTRRFR